MQADLRHDLMRSNSSNQKLLFFISISLGFRSNKLRPIIHVLLFSVRFIVICIFICILLFPFGFFILFVWGYFLIWFFPSSIYSWSIQPLYVLHSQYKCEWVTLESMICRSVTQLNLVTYIYLFWDTDYNQPFQIN